MSGFTNITCFAPPTSLSGFLGLLETASFLPRRPVQGHRRPRQKRPPLGDPRIPLRRWRLARGHGPRPPHLRLLRLPDRRPRAGHAEPAGHRDRDRGTGPADPPDDRRPEGRAALRGDVRASRSSARDRGRVRVRRVRIEPFPAIYPPCFASNARQMALSSIVPRSPVAFSSTAVCTRTSCFAGSTKIVCPWMPSNANSRTGAGRIQVW